MFGWDPINIISIADSECSKAVTVLHQTIWDPMDMLYKPRWIKEWGYLKLI